MKHALTLLRDHTRSLLQRVDPTAMGRSDAARWRDCRTMADLGEAVVAWLAGEVTQTPGHCGPPAEETYPLIPSLIVLNRAGFVTDNSQLAGNADGHTWNTWVAGFATDETLARLRAAVDGTPLILRACRGRDHECGHRRFALPPCPRGDVTDFWATACPQAADLLWEAWWVYAEDPEPGRNDRLWLALEAIAEGGPS
jgi:hypothetical protein